MIQFTGILKAGHISNGLWLCNVAASDPVHFPETVIQEGFCIFEKFSIYFKEAYQHGKSGGEGATAVTDSFLSNMELPYFDSWDLYLMDGHNFVWRTAGYYLSRDRDNFPVLGFSRHISFRDNLPVML
ncbi:MAG: hypothetical protein HZC10_06505 [Nitrospirae bacterium]|nr:hypothetical protein [Nitrospirota bacterium]